MKELPKISVVTITYGHEKYILDTIKSVLMQNFLGKIEFIISNDNSPDNSDKIIRNYIEEEEIPENIEIKYYNHEINKGSMSNFYWCLNQAKGKYIALCEGDDYWTDPLKLQKQFDILENNQDISFCFHNAKVLNLFNNTAYLFNKILSRNIFTIKDVIMKSWFTPTASFFFRNNIDFNVDWKNVNGDMKILYMNALNGKLYYINEVMSVYRYGSDNSLSKKAFSNEKKALLKLYNKKFSLINEFNLYTKYKFFPYTFFLFLKTVISLIINILRR